MPWGKHKGKLLTEVPRSYLLWAYQAWQNAPAELRQAIKAVLMRAPPKAPPAVDWSVVLRNWYRGLARDYHPDRGGSVEAMNAINEARDRLRQLVGV
jgi:hypothetical protein